jgi:hypothetical protein
VARTAGEAEFKPAPSRERTNEVDDDDDDGGDDDEEGDVRTNAVLCVASAAAGEVDEEAEGSEDETAD